MPPGGTSERRNSLPKDAALEKKSRYSDSSTVLSEAMLAKVKLLFDKLDQDGDGTVTKKEAQAFWKKNWANVNATAMFNEVDDDGARVYRRSNTPHAYKASCRLLTCLALSRVQTTAR